MNILDALETHFRLTLIWHWHPVDWAVGYWFHAGDIARPQQWFALHQIWIGPIEIHFEPSVP